MSNPCVFVFGCPRSRTTLLRRIVSGHSQIAIIPRADLGTVAAERATQVRNIAPVPPNVRPYGTA